MNFERPVRRQRFLLIALLASLALSQPLFDLLGRQAEFLVAHHMGAIDLWLFALILGLAIPLALGTLQRFTGIIGFLVLGTTLAALAALPVLIRAGLDGLAAVGGGLLVAVAVIAAHWRWATVRLFSDYLSPAIVLFPLLFLFFSRATPLLQGETGDQEAVHLASAPDIIFLVLDEFPLVSLLDSHLEIDRQRFPHFARLAERSNWYSGATTPAETTVGAVPALLSGTLSGDASALPILAHYPRNLFTLLQEHYSIEATEVATRLCPSSACSTESTDWKERGSKPGLLSDLVTVYRHLVTPRPWSGQLPAISHGWSGFRDEEFERARQLAEAWTLPERQVSWHERGAAMESFIDGISNRPEPQLYYYHALLPHAEWRYLPDGRQYLDYERWEALQAPQPGGIADTWREDPFAVQQQWQRHLLQVAYVDQLVGKLFERLEDQGMFDQSLVVIAGDHGASFEPGQPRRSINRQTLSDISAVPLFIRFPGQDDGVVIDGPASLLDVMPTLVNALGAQMDWAFQGSPLQTQVPPRPKLKVLRGTGEVYETSPHEHREHLQRRAVQQAGIFGNGFADLYAIGPHPDLLASVADTLPLSAATGGHIELENGRHLLNVDPDSAWSPRLLRGRLIGGTVTGQLPLAVVVNGVIRATTQTGKGPDQNRRFSALLPPGALREGENDIDIYAIVPVGNRATLTPWPDQPPRQWTLDGITGEATVSDGSTSFPVIADRHSGRVAASRLGDGAMINLVGSTGDSVPSGSPVIVFANGRFAGATESNGVHYTMLIDGSGNQSGPEMSVRVFFVDTGSGLATEVKYPPACAGTWPFSMSRNDAVLECRESALPLVSLNEDQQAVIDFADPGATSILARGWGRPANGIAWSLGKSATLKLPIGARPGDLKLTLQLRPWLHPPALKQQSIWISAGDQLLYSGVLDNANGETLEWIVPAALTGATQSMLELNILLPDAASPYSLGAGPDRRMLGVALSRIVIHSD